MSLNLYFNLHKTLKLTRFFLVHYFYNLIWVVVHNSYILFKKLSNLFFASTSND